MQRVRTHRSRRSHRNRPRRSCRTAPRRSVPAPWLRGSGRGGQEGGPSGDGTAGGAQHRGNLGEGGRRAARAHCSVARSSHMSMAPLESLSKRANASRHASISSFDRFGIARGRRTRRPDKARRAARNGTPRSWPPRNATWKMAASATWHCRAPRSGGRRFDDAGPSRGGAPPGRAARRAAARVDRRCGVPGVPGAAAARPPPARGARLPAATPSSASGELARRAAAGGETLARGARVQAAPARCAQRGP